MASPKRRESSQEQDLTKRSDFQLLNDFTQHIGSHSSGQLKSIAWEIMRRYTAHLEASAQSEPKNYGTTLGNALWGDAKRVEQIFGIKRGVLLRLADEGAVKGCSLESEHAYAGAGPSTRAKRLYCLVSIAQHLEACSEKANPTCTR